MIDTTYATKSEVTTIVANKADTNHYHTASYTPAGSVSQPSFTGKEVSTGSPASSGTVSVAGTAHKHSVTAEGTVSQPTFSGTSATISASYTPAGTVT